MKSGGRVYANRDISSMRAPREISVTIVERHAGKVRVMVSGLSRDVGDGPCAVHLAAVLTPAPGGFQISAVEELQPAPADQQCFLNPPRPAVIELDAPIGMAPHTIVRSLRSGSAFDVDAGDELADE